jgi:hypothetical protein
VAAGVADRGNPQKNYLHYQLQAIRGYSVAFAIEQFIPHSLNHPEQCKYIDLSLVELLACVFSLTYSPAGV